MANTTFAPRPAITETPDWEFPEPGIFTLSNGMRVWHFELAGQRLCELSIVLPTSVLDDPEGKEGLCTLAADAILEGPEGSDSASFARALQTHGARVHNMSSTEGTSFGLSAPTNRVKEAFELFASALRNPRLDARDIARLKSSQMEEIAMTQFDLASRARLEFAQLYFPDGRRDQFAPHGTLASVGSITEEEVRAFAREAFSPARGFIVTAGDFTAEASRDILESAIGDWTGPTTSHVTGTGFTPKTSGLVLIDEPGSPLTHLIYALPTPLRDDEDWGDILTAVNALGGSMESMLNIRMREEKGYTYGVSARVNATEHLAFLSVESSVDASVAKEAAADLLDVVTTVLRDGLGESDHDRSVRELTGSTALSFERAGDIASMAARLATWHLTTDWLREEREAIEETTVDSIKAALAKLPADKGLLLAVGSELGDPSEWQDLGLPVQRLEPATEHDLIDAEADVL